MKNHQRLQNLRSIVFIVGIFLLLFRLAMLIPAITNKCLSYKWKNFLAGFIIIAFLIIVRTGHRKAESTARRKDSNRGMFFLALFFIANQ